MGVELAGEIRTGWPDKAVTIVDVAVRRFGVNDSRLELRSELRRQLEEINVELVLGSALQERASTVPGELADLHRDDAVGPSPSPPTSGSAVLV